MNIRPATMDDVPAVKAVTDAAYQHGIGRIGLVPDPMPADHGENVAAGRVFAAVPGCRVPGRLSVPDATIGT